MTKTKFELCVPIYNEAGIIERTVTTLAETLSKRKDLEWQVTVVDNCSTDNSRELVLALLLPNVRLMQLSEKGKGGAVVTAARRTDADIFGFIDADLSVDPSCILPMVERVEKGEADAIVGSRMLDASRVNRGIFRKFVSWCFRTLRKLILGVEVEDSQCPLKIMNRPATAVLADCKERTWFFDIELLALLTKRGFTFKEVPIIWEENRYEGRKSKIRFSRDAVDAFFALFRIRNRLDSSERAAQRQLLLQNNERSLS